MKKALVGVLGAALVLVAAPSHQAIMLSFAPATQNATVGLSTSVALAISGLGAGAAPSLSAFDLNVAFDSNVVSFLGLTFGDPVLGDQLDLFGLGSLAGTTPGLGVVNLFELSLDSSADLNAFQAGSFTLATLTLRALAIGSSPLGISVNALGDASGNSLTATIAGGSVTTAGGNAVPEPATLLLTFAGLIMIAMLRVANRDSLRSARDERALR